MDELFPLIEALQLLGFAHVSGGDIELTASAAPSPRPTC